MSDYLMFVHTPSTITEAFNEHCKGKNASLVAVTKFSGADHSEATVKCDFCSAIRYNYLLRLARNKKATSVCNNRQCIMQRKSIKQRINENELFVRINESLLKKNILNDSDNPFNYKNFVSLQTTKFKGICGTCGNEVNPLLNNLLDETSGCCVTCASSGFKKNMVGYLYIIHIYDDVDGELEAIKVGITNNLRQRYNIQTSKSNLDTKTFCNVWEGSGNDIYDIEKSVKKYFKHKNSYLDKSEYPDGYTETYNDLLHEPIVQFINVWVEYINSTIDLDDDESIIIHQYSSDELHEEHQLVMKSRLYDCNFIPLL